jgi:hypothetical protein
VLKILETPSGPVLVDDDVQDGPPTELQMLPARARRAEDDELRQRLRDEIQRRLREKGEAWEKLDRTIEKRANGG